MLQPEAGHSPDKHAAVQWNIPVAAGTGKLQHLQADNLEEETIHSSVAEAVPETTAAATGKKHAVAADIPEVVVDSFALHNQAVQRHRIAGLLRIGLRRTPAGSWQRRTG